MADAETPTIGDEIEMLKALAGPRGAWNKLMDQRARDLLSRLSLPPTHTHFAAARAEVERVDLNARLDVYRTLRMQRTDVSTELPKHG